MGSRDAFNSIDDSLQPTWIFEFDLFFRFAFLVFYWNGSVDLFHRVDRLYIRSFSPF
jgi:hypothetical protein